MVLTSMLFASNRYPAMSHLNVDKYALKLTSYKVHF